MTQARFTRVFRGVGLVALCAVSAWAQAQSATSEAARHAAHFQKAREFALQSIAERARILEVERQCVTAAANGPALQACHEQAHGHRQVLMQRLKPRYDELRAARP